MRSYEEIEKNAYKKAEIRLAEMQRRNTIIKRTALSSGICAAAIAGVWFVSGESTRDSFRKKHDEGIISDEEIPSEEYSGHIHLTTTADTVSAVSTTTAAEASTDVPEEIPVTTSAKTTEDVTAESSVTTTAKTTKDITAESPVTTSASSISRTTTKKTSVMTANRTTRTTQSSQPVSTDAPATTTAKSKTTSKRPATTTEVPDTTTYTTVIAPSPQPEIATTASSDVPTIPLITSTVTTDDGAVPVTTTTKGGWNYDSEIILPETTTTAVPSAPEQPTVVNINNSADAKRIFTTYTDFDGVEYILVDPKKRPRTDKLLYVTLLSVYDPDKKIYYNAYVNMYSLKDSNMILMRNSEFSLYYEPVL